MSHPNPIAQTRVIPRQMAGGIVFIVAAIVIVSAIAVRMFPAPHGPAKEIPTAPLPERIAPVAKVEIGAAPAAAPTGEAAPAANPAAAPASAPAPAADKPATKDGRAEAPSAAAVAAAAATPDLAAAAAPAAVAETAAAVSAGAAPAVPAEAAAEAAKPAPKPLRINGRFVYQRTCSACHANGIAGAPRTGDIKAWGPRIAAGTDALQASVINGKGAMPPRGGNPKLTDGEIRAAVEYMLNQFASR